MAGIIAAGHPLSAEAGRYALCEGGNAIDAAIAAVLASWTSEPVLSTPGGGGFALLQRAGSASRLLDGFAQTPLQRNTGAVQHLVEADFGPSRQGFYLGPGSIATPGVVALLDQLHRRGARLPWKVLFAPAIDHARNGVVVTAAAARLFQVVRELYLGDAACRAVYGRPEEPSQPLAAGDRWRHPPLADFLEELASEGARFFYEGEVAALVAGVMQTRGGHLQRADFSAYRVEDRTPLRYAFRGHTVLSNPPPSLGGRFVELGLTVLARGLRELPQPEHPEWPAALAALQRELTAGWRGLAAEPLLPAPEDPFWETWKRRPEQPRVIRGTTHFSTMDTEGNAVALTVSNGSGSGVLVPEAGFMLNNMLGETDLWHHSDPQDWPTNTRIASMMAPTIVELASGGRLATGSGGSQRIRTTLLQVLLRILAFGARGEDAVRAPRLHAEEGRIHLERGFSEAQQNALANLPEPPELVWHEPGNLFFGGAHSVFQSPDGGLSGIGDERRGGLCLRG